MAECPRAALSSPDLPLGAKVVLAALWSYAGGSGRFVWPSRDALAVHTALKPRTLRKHLALLRDLQWITEADGTNGRPGWHLCDPPATAVHTADEAPAGEHNRPEAAARSCRTPARSCQNVAQETPIETPQRHVHAATPARSCRSYSIGTNQEPIKAEVRSSVIVQGAEASAEPPPPGRAHRLSATAWRSDFVFAWRAKMAFEACGYRVSDPTSGAHRLVELQRMLDEHGPEVVQDVLLHAGARVVRYHDSKGRHGLYPGALAVTFRADKPQAFDALLDAWQGDQGRRRASGRLRAAPGELDGIPLSDEEQRVWMREGSEQEAEDAVRDHRAQAVAESNAVQWGNGLGFGEGAA